MCYTRSVLRRADQPIVKKRGSEIDPFFFSESLKKSEREVTQRWILVQASRPLEQGIVARLCQPRPRRKEDGTHGCRLRSLPITIAAITPTNSPTTAAMPPVHHITRPMTSRWTGLSKTFAETCRLAICQRPFSFTRSAVQRLGR